MPNMAEKEISLMGLIGRGVSGLQLVCLLCLRATLRGQCMCRGPANRTICKQAGTQTQINTKEPSKEAD